MVRFINGKPYSVGQFPESNYSNKDNVNRPKSTTSFKDVLNDKINDNEFKVSAHASQRMRDLNLTKEDNKKLTEAFDKAKEKGCKNSVFLYKDVAFIASVENRTIITAVERERAKENVFTNIDSVVVL